MILPQTLRVPEGGAPSPTAPPAPPGSPPPGPDRGPRTRSSAGRPPCSASSRRPRGAAPLGARCSRVPACPDPPSGARPPIDPPPATPARVPPAPPPPTTAPRKSRRNRRSRRPALRTRPRAAAAGAGSRAVRVATAGRTGPRTRGTRTRGPTGRRRGRQGPGLEPPSAALPDRRTRPRRPRHSPRAEAPGSGCTEAGSPPTRAARDACFFPPPWPALPAPPPRRGRSAERSGWPRYSPAGTGGRRPGQPRQPRPAPFPGDAARTPPRSAGSQDRAPGKARAPTFRTYPTVPSRPSAGRSTGAGGRRGPGRTVGAPTGTGTPRAGRTVRRTTGSAPLPGSTHPRPAVSPAPSCVGPGPRLLLPSRRASGHAACQTTPKIAQGFLGTPVRSPQGSSGPPTPGCLSDGILPR
jgi:hypothetical protein